MKQLLNLITICSLFFAMSCSKSNDAPGSGGNGTTQPPPTSLALTDFNPKSANVGTTVMITGTAFGSDVNAVGIKFGTSASTNPKTVTATAMSVIVPADAKTGKIQITIGGSTVTSSADFTLTTVAAPTPTISSFSPQTAKAGEVVTITGTGFGTDTNFVSVKFGTSISAKPKTVSAVSMTVVVPTSASTGNIQLTVNSGIPITSTGIFTLKPTYLAITSFTPKTVTEGDTLIINGTFGPVLSDVKVFLNTTNSTFTQPIKSSTTQLSVIVPHEAGSGKVRVINNSLPFSDSFVDSQDNLTVLPITYVYQITPSSARAGEIITINGDFYLFNVANISVNFSGSAITVKPLALQNSNILVRVPSDAKTGKIKVTKLGFGTGSSLAIFNVLPQMPNVLPGTWTQRPDFGATSGKAGAVSFVVNNVAFVACGTTNAPFDGLGSSEMWAYDPVYNAWEQKANFSGGNRTNAVAFAIGSKGYVGTGLNGSGVYTNDFWEYDPTANIWSQKADFKGSARGSAVGFAIGNNGFIGTGSTGVSNNSNSVNDFYAYNPAANSWTQITSIPGNRNGAFAFVVNNKAYIGGGNIAKTPITDMYMFDPVSNSWTAEAAISSYDYTSANTSFTIGNYGYVGLGYKVVNGQQVVTNQVFQYSVAANSWSALPNFGGVSRSSGVGFAIGSIGYFGMGQPNGNVGVYKDFWAYTP